MIKKSFDEAEEEKEEDGSQSFSIESGSLKNSLKASNNLAVEIEVIEE